MKNLTEKGKENLLILVIREIKKDLNDNYLEALEELLQYIPNENLLAYLPEDISNDFLNN
jgi:hypothetical protein